MEKKEQVYQHIRSDTITKLKEEQFESLGLDTLTVSLDLKMNRANISRLLNQLYNEGRLIKTDSRPVFFMDRSALDRYVEHAYIPSIIPKDKTIKDYLLPPMHLHPRYDRIISTPLTAISPISVIQKWQNRCVRQSQQSCILPD